MSDEQNETAVLADYTIKRITANEWQIWLDGRLLATVDGKTARDFMLGRIDPAKLRQEEKADYGRK